jgi:membrane protein implicated in regulation of membrane protease activity
VGLVVAWLIAGLVCLGIEALTLAFVMAYFGVGAFAAAAAAALDAPLEGQIAVFAVVSLTLLLFTRRLIVDLVGLREAEQAPPHALIGRGAVVTIPVSAHESSGQIRIGSEFWTARPVDDDGTPIPAGAAVEVVDVVGVTARVRPRRS